MNSTLLLTTPNTISALYNVRNHLKTAVRFISDILYIKKHYDLRKHLQKVEFFACWTIAISAAANYVDRTLSSETILYYSSLYLKASVVSRALAYTSDFSNASERFSGDLPLWLILHHCGCLVLHFSKAVFLLDAGSRSQIILFTLASQSSHNTWTKKHSLFLYWGNVLVGVVTCCRIHFSHEDTDYEGAALSFFFSLVVTSIGIMLLVAGSKGQAQIYLTMKQTGRVWAKAKAEVF